MEFKEEQKRLALEHRKAWEVDIQEKHRLEKMAEAKDTLANEIMTRRAADFARLEALLFATSLPVFFIAPGTGCSLGPCAVLKVCDRQPWYLALEKEDTY